MVSPDMFTPMPAPLTQPSSHNIKDILLLNTQGIMLLFTLGFHLAFKGTDYLLSEEIPVQVGIFDSFLAYFMKRQQNNLLIYSWVQSSNLNTWISL